MNTPTLFDPDRTTPQTCTVNGCPAIRFPNQTRVPTCKHDLDLGEYRGKRPRRCLNHYDPATTPFPDGY